MKQKLLGLALISSLTVFSGCAVNETATVKVTEDGSAKQLIVSNSGFLSASLKIIDTKIGSAGDLMKVQASIENQSRNDASFQYKFKWLDKDDFEISIDSRPWQPLTITAYESKSVQAVAPNPRAKGFQILVQD